MSKKKLAVRAQFREEVFTRDGYRCAICRSANMYGLDAHHIISRKKLPNGGYTLDNGISLCPEHHKAAEAGTISVATLRRAIGVET